MSLPPPPPKDPSGAPVSASRTSATSRDRSHDGAALPTSTGRDDVSTKRFAAWLHRPGAAAIRTTPSAEKVPSIVPRPDQSLFDSSGRTSISTIAV